MTGVIIFLILLLLSSYKKARPDQAFIISGLGKQKVVIGKAAFVIPFLQRLDILRLNIIPIDVKANRIPTIEFINISTDAIANIQIDPELISTAAKNFLNKDETYIANVVREVLEGNMREIVGQLELKSLVNRRDEFSLKVQENVTDDMNRLGVKVLNFNVQNFYDENHAIEDLGIDNLAQIQKNAKIAKAQADRDVEIETAKAVEEGNKARIEANKKIAQQNQELSIAESEAKVKSDTKRAEAEAAGRISAQIQNKTINEKQIEAETAKAEKMLDLKEREIKLKEKELDATIKKKADAERYAAEQVAEAELFKRKKQAEAKLEEARKDAEAISLKGKAEAEAIKLKKLAEAEGIAKRAEAESKMEQASVVRMLVNTLPLIAKEISAPLNNVDSITMYDPNGTTKLLESGTKNMEQVMNVAKTAGLDLPSLISGFLGGKVASKTPSQNAPESTRETKS